MKIDSDRTIRYFQTFESCSKLLHYYVCFQYEEMSLIEKHANYKAERLSLLQQIYISKLNFDRIQAVQSKTNTLLRHIKPQARLGFEFDTYRTRNENHNF